MMTEPSFLPSPPSGDLQKAKASVWKAAAKMLGVLATSLIPAAVVWLQADAEAKKAQAEAALAARAAAVEKARGQVTYDALNARLSLLEGAVEACADITDELDEATRGQDLELARVQGVLDVLQRRFRIRTPAQPEPEETSSPAREGPLGRFLEGKKPPPKDRPAPPADHIQQIEAGYKKGDF